MRHCITALLHYLNAMLLPCYAVAMPQRLHQCAVA